MHVTLDIPDDIALRLQLNGGEAPRTLLETVALAGYRTGDLSHREVGSLLGLSRLEVDGFLKNGGSFLDYTLDDLEEDSATLRRFGFK